MKEFLAAWIVFQLIVIGLASGGAITNCKNNSNPTYEEMEKSIQNTSDFMVRSILLLIPLSVFVPKDTLDCDSN